MIKYWREGLTYQNLHHRLRLHCNLQLPIGPYSTILPYTSYPSKCISRGRETSTHAR